MGILVMVCIITLSLTFNYIFIKKYLGAKEKNHMYENKIIEYEENVDKTSKDLRKEISELKRVNHDLAKELEQIKLEKQDIQADLESKGWKKE